MPKFPKTLVVSVDAQTAEVLKDALKISLEKLKRSQFVGDMLQVVVAHKHAECGEECGFVAELPKLESAIKERELLTRVLESLVAQCNSDADVVQDNEAPELELSGASVA